MDTKPVSQISNLSYVIRQDTLFIQRHAFFDLSAVTDNRLADHHVVGNMNIVPDVGMVQVYMVTCCNRNRTVNTIIMLLSSFTCTQIVTAGIGIGAHLWCSCCQ